MAFDNSTRNRLQRLVGDCRDLLTREFDAMLQEFYGIYASDGRVMDLEKLPHLNDEELRNATLLRERIQHLASGGGGTPAAIGEAVKRVLREQAFTVLNRFAALRMAEERDIIVESVGGGLNSKGFKAYSEVAYSGLGGSYERYRVFLRCMFEEMAVELGVLFDPQSPYGLLFPRESVLLELFERFNAADLKPLWKEDETIGWIYQYFNDPAERKKMRDESSAPRNSRELAVRNQFFTPRYVVEFLTDNTLGRIWYEMCGSGGRATSLAEKCRYLVRRPNEAFLKAGETAPEQPMQDKLSQEDLLNQPVFIPHRPLKDPRTILMLDPACGSMHFGLYAFDLYEIIYAEAWELEGVTGASSLARPAEMKSLRETFVTKEEFLRQVPRLIIEHNLHGIDIDLRCAQIAGLSLWLRAQKMWKDMGLKPAERPAIKRSNIVCAEPMPGEKELLREFVEREFPAAECGVFLQLLETIFDKMQLAGEAGSLLKIEEEISSAITTVKKLWKVEPQLEQPKLFGELEPTKQKELTIDLSGITDEQFWDTAESRIYVALRDYAEQAENGGGFQRRLFAEDAARGFAFIDVCRKRYEVVLMNPPFGSFPHLWEGQSRIDYPNSSTDIFATFVERGLGLLEVQSRLGAITSRSGFFLTSFQKWRERILLAKASPTLLADLGHGVMDAALVEAAAYCLEKQPQSRIESPSVFFRVLEELDDKKSALTEAIHSPNSWAGTRYFLASPRSFSIIQGSPFAYWLSENLKRMFKEYQPLEGGGRTVKVGDHPGDGFRFIRLWWEVPIPNTCDQWVSYQKGGAYSPYFPDIHLVANWDAERQSYKGFLGRPGRSSERPSNYEFFFRPGLTWSRRTKSEISLRVLPADCIFSDKGPAAFVDSDDHQDLLCLLAITNSSMFRALLATQLAAADAKRGGAARSYEVGLIQRTPLPPIELQMKQELVELTIRSWNAMRQPNTAKLTGHSFVCPPPSDSRWSLANGVDAYSVALAKANTVFAEAQEKIDGITYNLYGANDKDRVTIADLLSQNGGTESEKDQEEDEEVVEVAATSDSLGLVAGILDYWIGTAFGRWDIRYATGAQAAPEVPDPFAPLPVCPPGQLQNAQGLPARPEDVPATYPVHIPWDGILVDDPNHPLDIERRVREVIEIIWSGPATSQRTGGPTTEAIEHEACEILGVNSLRDYSRKPAGFFADHLKRYSKSRRQAPIYWPLSTTSGSYTLWIYYHRLTDQTLFQCVNEFVKPKITEVEGDLSRHTTTGADKPGTRSEIERLTTLRAELVEFRDELLRVAQLPYKPDLNDGVLITASPLWKLFRLPKWQKDLKACWQDLEKGEYDWAHLAYTVWPDRVKEVCKKDRSIAIAHGLEELCGVKAPEKKTKKSKKKEQMGLEEAT